MKKTIYFAVILLCFTLKIQGQVLEYKFNNNFNETCNLAPALLPLCNDTFYTDTLVDLGSITKNAYHFSQNCGLHFDNIAAGNFISKSYSLEVYFKFDSSVSFSRILDFKNRSADFGLYCTDNILQFYNAVSTPTTAFASGQYVHLVVTRDSVSGLVCEFVNGALLDSFTDVNEIAVIDTSGILSFFQDDQVFGNEANSGAIALLKIYSVPLDSNQVDYLFDKLSITFTPNNFTVNDSIQCLSNNNFIFSNNSPDTVIASFKWFFGDGDSAVSINAQHHYDSAGIFQVSMITYSLAGCPDTVNSTVTIHENPQPDLGTDRAICNQDSITLDAGLFSTYFWVDGSNTRQITTNLPGQYWVFVLDSNGCLGSDTINLTAGPFVELGSDTLICKGSVVFLDAGSMFSSYLWSTGSTAQNLAVIDSGAYIVTVTDSLGCSNSDTVNVGLLPSPEVELGNDTSFCQGGIITLDAGIANAYLWQDGSTGQTFTTDSSGLYSVQATGASGCTITDFISINVNANPVINLGNDTVFCGSLNYTLQAGSNFNSYLWSDGSTLSSYAVSDSGSYFVLITDSNSCKGSDTISIGLANPPSIDLGNDTSFCSGASIILDAGSGFTSYLWNDGSTLSTVNASASGIYSVLVTDSSGCNATDSLLISLAQAITVTLGNDTSVCFGNSLSLNAGPGFVNYAWSNGDSVQITQVNGSGVYFVEVTDSIGCKGTDSVNVTVNLLPFTPIIFLGPGNTLFSNQPFGNQWYDANGIIAGATDSFYLPTQAGSYYAVVTDSNGCQSYPSNIIVYGLGLSYLADSGIKIYPNPVSENIHIYLNENNIHPQALNIFDADGRKIKSIILQRNASVNGSFKINVKDLIPGVYLLELVSDSKCLRNRFIKQ